MISMNVSDCLRVTQKKGIGAEPKGDGGVDGEGAGVDQEGDKERKPDVGL